MSLRTLREELEEEKFRVSIFGSARIKMGDPRYKQVNALGKMLGEKGIDLVTGGGAGLMVAANSGHKLGSKKSGAHSIGLNIKLPNEQKANKHLDVKKEFSIFSDRLDEFMLLSNVVVVAPGGVGTLLELMYSWQLVQVEHVCNMPIILMGDMWKGFLEWLRENPLKLKMFDEKDYYLLFWAKTPREAMEVINEAYEAYKMGDKNFCLNYKKYKIK